MAKGRKPKPSRIKAIEGNPGKRPINAKEPKPKGELPPAPAHLRAGARKAWARLASRLETSGIATAIDAIALEVLCEAYADLLEARRKLKRFGSNYYETVNQAGGKMHRAHPALAAVRDADRRLRGWLAEFGMTPSARSRVDAAGQEGADPADEFLND